MLSLAVYLLVVEAGGTPAAAGLTSGSVGAGNALGLLIQGWLIGRHGMSRVIGVCAVLCPAALIGVVASPTAGPRTYLIAGIAGVSVPATTACMRVLWTVLIDDQRARASAYALLATSFQAALIIGPLTVTGARYLGGAVCAVVLAAILSGVGGLAFAVSPACRAQRPPRSGPTGPLRLSSGLRTLLAGGFGSGIALGIMVIAVAGARPALAGTLFALFAVGELSAGLVYGATFRIPVPVRLFCGMAGMAIVLALLTVGHHGIAAAAFLMTIGGVFAAPVAIANSALLDDVVPAAALAQSYTGVVAAGLLGNAVGNSAGGYLTEHASVAAAFAVGAAILACTAVILAIRRNTLLPAPLETR
ncbi:hypothetical protein [Actinoplanes palleronii]|nr:hypothetical protein [Actinoplanes palleronii]